MTDSISENLTDSDLKSKKPQIVKLLIFRISRII